MPICTPILAFKIDERSLAALKRIESKTKLGKLLAATITTGIFNSIFTKNKPPVTITWCSNLLNN